MIPSSVRLAVALALALAAVPAPAHVLFADPAATADAYYTGFLRVGHGCAGSPTLSIRVEIPAGVTVARPQPKPGWTIMVEKATLPAPVRADGVEVRERVTAITWSGRLEGDQFDQFGLMLKLPAAPGPLYFPTVQRCAAGREDWTMVPAAGQSPRALKMPAPVLNLTAGAGDPMRGMAM